MKLRQAFAETLIEIAENNSRVIFLTGDLGFQVFDGFKERFEHRYVNVGVAEAQLILSAAGLAMEGWRPVVYSIASFITARAFEQIKISVDYPNLPVILVGGGGGYIYAKSGVTHHAADDVALMSILPNMTVVNPGDPNEVKALLSQLIQLQGPAYIRIGRYGETRYQLDSPIILKRARKLKDGEKIAIITTGDSAADALAAASVLKSEGIYPIIYQMHTIKPIDTVTLELLLNEVKNIIVVEESIPIGGLAAMIQAWILERGENARLVRLGPPDALVLGNPERDEVKKRLGYDAPSIVEMCKSML